MKFRAASVCLFSAIACVLTLSKLSAAAPAALSSAAAPYGAYLYVYFAGESDADGEQIHFAISDGTSATSFTALNGGKPVLRSTVGTRGVRDPTIVRTADGFKIIATDLTIYGRTVDWDREQRTGSRNIVVWDSVGDDLSQWGPSRLSLVSPATAGNTWAPDAVQDPTTSGQWHVYWASTIYAASDVAHTEPRTQVWDQILWSTTKDFKTFAPATVWENAGHDVFDTTVVRDSDGTYYRFSHDIVAGADGGFVRQERAQALEGPWTGVAEGIGRGVVGYAEGPLAFKSLTVPGRWHLWVDNDNPGYFLFETDDIASGKWRQSVGVSIPVNSRHGYVIPVTWHERNQVVAKWGRNGHV